MYNFNVGDKEYKIKISYEVDDTMFDDGQTRRVTCASILEVNDEGLDHIAYGESVCHPKDNFVKRLGREKAVKAAISYAYQACAVPPDETFAKAAIAAINK